MADNLDGIWRTVGGRRIFIKSGQDLATAMKESGKFTNSEKQKKLQLNIIKKYNPMTDEYHTGIRTIEDINTYKEAINNIESFAYPDFSKEDGLLALKNGKITIYSSQKIKQGTFVTPSKKMAQDYAGSNEVYSKEVKINDVAWINADEGQLAQIINKKKSKK